MEREELRTYAQAVSVGVSAHFSMSRCQISEEKQQSHRAVTSINSTRTNRCGSWSDLIKTKGCYRYSHFKEIFEQRKKKTAHKRLVSLHILAFLVFLLLTDRKRLNTGKKCVRAEGLTSQWRYCVKILCVYSRCREPLLYLWLGWGVQLILRFGSVSSRMGTVYRYVIEGQKGSTGCGLTVKYRFISIIHLWLVKLLVWTEHSKSFLDLDECVYIWGRNFIKQYGFPYILKTNSQCSYFLFLLGVFLYNTQG